MLGQVRSTGNPRTAIMVDSIVRKEWVFLETKFSGTSWIMWYPNIDTPEADVVGRRYLCGSSVQHLYLHVEAMPRRNYRLRPTISLIRGTNTCGGQCERVPCLACEEKSGREKKIFSGHGFFACSTPVTGAVGYLSYGRCTTTRSLITVT